MDGDERRHGLRRLDDVLEALEQANLREDRILHTALLVRLSELGVANPETFSTSKLIEKVLDLQKPLMARPAPVERRARRRRRFVPDPRTWLDGGSS